MNQGWQDFRMSALFDIREIVSSQIIHLFLKHLCYLSLKEFHLHLQSGAIGATLLSLCKLDEKGF